MDISNKIMNILGKLPYFKFVKFQNSPNLSILFL